MSLKDLTKEQKQYMVLGALGGIILVALAVMGGRMSLRSVATARQDLEALTSKIDSADRLLKRRETVNREYALTVEALRKHMENAPPERNYYTWANKVIYEMARSVGLEIESIDEMSIARNSSKAASATAFESYSLRITAQGSYDSTKAFVKAMKQSYTLVRFAGVDINSGRTPENHNVQFSIQWPFNLSALAKNWENVELQQRLVDQREGTDNDAAAEPEPSSEPEATTLSSEPPAATRQPTPPPPRFTEEAAVMVGTAVESEPVPDTAVAEPEEVFEVESSEPVDQDNSLTIEEDPSTPLFGEIPDELADEEIEADSSVNVIEPEKETHLFAEMFSPTSATAADTFDDTEEFLGETNREDEVFEPEDPMSDDLPITGFEEREMTASLLSNQVELDTIAVGSETNVLEETTDAAEFGTDTAAWTTNRAESVTNLFDDFEIDQAMVTEEVIISTNDSNTDSDIQDYLNSLLEEDHDQE